MCQCLENTAQVINEAVLGAYSLLTGAYILSSREPPEKSLTVNTCKVGEEAGRHLYAEISGSDLRSVTNDHMPSTCGLKCCLQLTTDTESVIWRESLFTIHSVPHDTASIPAGHTIPVVVCRSVNKALGDCYTGHLNIACKCCYCGIMNTSQMQTLRAVETRPNSIPQGSKQRQDAKAIADSNYGTAEKPLLTQLQRKAA